MNASEVLKGFAMKQVYGYLDKDPDTNIPKLLDMLEDNDDVQNVYHNWEE